jgi:hypothetical protein
MVPPMRCLCKTIAPVMLGALLLAPTPAAADPDCKCRLYDKKLEVGTITCIKGKLAQCLMFQNTPSWKYLNATCPVSFNKSPWRAPAVELVQR